MKEGEGNVLYVKQTWRSATKGVGLKGMCVCVCANSRDRVKESKAPGKPYFLSDQYAKELGEKKNTMAFWGGTQK